MKKNILKIIGISFFSFALVANLQFALLDYGLGTNSLGLEVIAQTSTSGGGSGSGSGSGGDDDNGYKSKLTTVTVEVETIINPSDSTSVCNRRRGVTTIECIGEGDVTCSAWSGAGDWSAYECP